MAQSSSIDYHGLSLFVYVSASPMKELNEAWGFNASVRGRIQYGFDVKRNAVIINLGVVVVNGSKGCVLYWNGRFD